MEKKNKIFVFLIALILLMFAVFALLLKLDFFEKKEGAELVIEETEKGLTRVIGGDIVEVNRSGKYLIVDIDPLGGSKKYTIYIDSGTDFFAIAYPKIERKKPEIIDGVPVFEDNIQDLLKPETRSVSFSEFEKGMKVEVRFEDYVDIDKEKKLIAQSLHTIIQEK